MRVLVFDSGIGGLGIARALRVMLPRASLTYLADGAGFPYGGQTDAALTGRVLRVVEAGLHAAGPDLVVVACNTASTVALDALRRRFPVPFVGCVPPVRWAARISRTRTIGLLATPATVRRPYLADLVHRFAADCTVLAHGAPPLASLAEAKFAGGSADPALVRAEVEAMARQPGGERLDAVALGCTHYALLLPELRAALPGDVAWLDPAEPVARQAASVAAGLVAAGLPRRGGRGADGVALHTGRLPVGRAAQAWSDAGFTRAVELAGQG